MARARNLKPSFFTDDEIAELPPLARLLFAGLWCIADREGRLEDRSKKIKAEILPYDNCNVERLLAELAARRFIIRYEVAGHACIQVRSFHKHQDPHYKEKPSVLPPPPGQKDMGGTGGGVSEEIRQRVFDRDGRKCTTCGSTEDLSLDHIVPRSKGGDHSEANLQTLCRRCNSGKNNRQSKANDRPIIGPYSAQPPGTLPPLIPDSLIPDSLNPLPDSGFLIPDPGSPQPAIAAGANSATPAPANGANGSRVFEKETPKAEDPWPRRIPAIADESGLEDCARAYGIDPKDRRFNSYAELQAACFTERNQRNERIQREREVGATPRSHLTRDQQLAAVANLQRLAAKGSA